MPTLPPLAPHRPVDALGRPIPPAAAGARIACLVPSITELLFALGLGAQVVARTHYCVHPAEAVAAVPAVGGTKKIKHRALRALAPTHVIVNIDENPREMAEALAEYVPQVIVTHPLGPHDNLALYRLLGAVFGRQDEAERLCGALTAGLGRLAARAWPPRRVLYLIWREPWMSVSRDTYIARTLALVSWQTWVAPTDARYPSLDLSAEMLAAVDTVLLSSEPYRFTVADTANLAAEHALDPARVRLIDAEMVSWYGSRAIAGLDYLEAFAAAGRTPARGRLSRLT